MRIALLAGGDGWHVRDLIRAAGALGHAAEPVDFRRVTAAAGTAGAPAGGRAGPGPVRRSDCPHHAAGVAGAGRLPDGPAARAWPPAASRCSTRRGPWKCAWTSTWPCVRLEAAGLPVPPTVVCQHADAALEAFDGLGGDVVVKPLFGAEGRGMVRVTDPELAWRTFRAIERMQAVLYVQQFIRAPRLGPAGVRAGREGARGRCGASPAGTGGRTWPRRATPSRCG